MPAIGQARVIVLATDGFEQSELEYPVKQLRDQGADVRIASPDGKDIRGWKDGGWGGTVRVDAAIGDLAEESFDALVLPGGQMNPDILRTKKEAVDLVRAFHNAGKPIAAICHGPWLLVEADVLKGRNATSYASIATDVKNAGATWMDREVVVDEAIITSRSPDDLPAFVAKIVEEIEEGPHERRSTEQTGRADDNRDTNRLAVAETPVSGQGREGGRLARDVGTRDELKRTYERPAGKTRVRKGDEDKGAT